MQSVLHLFVRHGEWIEDSEQIALTRGQGQYYGRLLHHWIKSFIIDTTSLPTNAWEPDLREELCNHLQSIGKYVKAQDVVNYLDCPGVKAKYSTTISVSLKTAQCWMKSLGYVWANTPTGCYVDGHEHDDVVNYHQNIFLPAWLAGEPCLQVWTDENIADPVQSDPSTRHDVHWHHNETVFCAHDHQEHHWVPYDETAVPQPKGEGHSLMVADFISADYGWLQSPDGTESACVLLQPGAHRDGYFTHSDVIAQVAKAMDILTNDTISACNMPVNTSAPRKNWFKVMKTVPMAPGTFADGSPQSFYFPKGHDQAGQFKGMRAILEEWECPGFRCPAGKANCCVQRLLYMQPDFQGVKSILEDHCAQRGFKLPPSSKENDLECNVLESLKSVTLKLICQFTNWSIWFMDSYRHGLNGNEAAWASKKYHSH
ncbi:hypothetical protein BDM02DRAFT_3241077 [Thelephora ganbajun]|uniref:Uncharacterized protein n=1 Tax=Thelephora ganbajun TaxID=370292 RepID=A0ACB6YYW3_THEGA|nr:hypothetical protein BDM02DRAFT_3241077 [Thelephora ganbajun]